MRWEPQRNRFVIKSSQDLLQRMDANNSQYLHVLIVYKTNKLADTFTINEISICSESSLINSLTLSPIVSRFLIRNTNASAVEIVWTEW